MRHVMRQWLDGRLRGGQHHRLDPLYCKYLQCTRVRCGRVAHDVEATPVQPARESSMSVATPPDRSDTASVSLLGLINGYQVTQAIYVVATLGIPDLLGDGPRDCNELAAVTDSHA